MRTSIVTTLLMIVLAGPAFGAAGLPASSASSAPAPAVPTAVVTPVRAAATTASDAQRYAAREQATPQLERYKGGAVAVYIGGSALAIAVLVVLLLILL